MQGTCFCPKQRSWYKARRGGHGVGIPRNFTCFQEGVSGTAQLSPACRLLTLFPVQFQVTATLESFQCCSRHGIERTVWSRDQPLGNVSPLWLSSSAPSVTPDHPTPLTCSEGQRWRRRAVPGMGCPGCCTQGHTLHGQALLGPSYLLSLGLGAQFTHAGKPLAPRSAGNGAGRDPTSAPPQKPKGNHCSWSRSVSQKHPILARIGDFVKTKTSK